MHLPPRTNPLQAARAVLAFTLVDLVAAMAALGLLAAVQVPSLINSQTGAQRAICLNNHRQLAKAWLAFAEDNDGRLPGNWDGGGADPTRTWCSGWLELDTAVSDNTNWAKMMSSQLGAYSGSHQIYKCPADNSQGAVPGGAKMDRVRSISMNTYLGELTPSRNTPYTTGYWQFKKYSEINSPSPSKCWVFIDEREDSINDGCFQIDMAGYDPRNPDGYIIVDYPADWHNAAGNVSFADGHAESRRWKDPRTMPLHRSGVELALGQPTPGNRDVAWLQERASRKNF